MALNPLLYTEKVVQSFLRYQLTTYAFADPRLNVQMRALLSLAVARRTPLLRGPYVSLSRAFAPGASVDQLVADRVLHPHMKQLIPFESVRGHQEQAIRAVVAGRSTLVSTGTGSGKSECFLYPIISRCLELRDAGAGPGICAVIVYPMNALAEDQLGRLRGLLAGSGVSFGMYVGKTPEHEAEVSGARLRAGASRLDYERALADEQAKGQGTSVRPAEEVCSREMMRTPGRQPRILLTNVKQLELLLTRHRDVELFDGALLDFLVFDEAHTFSGSQGAEAACLIRRLRSFCGRDTDRTVCVATSATIVDANNPDAARDFASRFFGVARNAIETVTEIYQEQEWSAARFLPSAPADPAAVLQAVLNAVDSSDANEVRRAYRALAGRDLHEGAVEETLYEALSSNELMYRAAGLLERPRELAGLLVELETVLGRAVSEEELVAWLTLGAAARRDDRPLVRPVVHGFLRGVPGAVVTFDGGAEDGVVLHLSAQEDGAEDDAEPVLRLPVHTCKTCGQHYFTHVLADFQFTDKQPGGGSLEEDGVVWQPLDEIRGGTQVYLLDRLISQEDDEEPEGMAAIHLCRACGAAHPRAEQRCLACGQAGALVMLYAVRQKPKHRGQLTRCACCGANGSQRGDRYRAPAKPVRATNVADIHVLAQDMIQHAERKRLLVFADNRQDAAFQAGWMRDHARRFRLRSLILDALTDGISLIGDLVHRIDGVLDVDDDLSMALLPEVWATTPKEGGTSVHREERRYLLRILVLREVTISAREHIGLEPWGRLKVQYRGLSESSRFVQNWAQRLAIPADELVSGLAALLDQIRQRRALLDRTGEIFTKFWAPGDREIESGYLPQMSDVPKGLVLTRESGADANRLQQWLGSKGHATAASEMAKKWGVLADDVPTFLRELWEHLVSPEVRVLVPVTLKGSKGRALPGCTGAHQIDADRLELAPNRGVFRCRTCRRRTVRRPPGLRCLAWRCDGELEFLPEDPDNYDLQVVDQAYEMLRPREHTAMVPHVEREKLEQIFKSASGAINTIVCTQTLELGVDIGSLDAVLMRNVPPLPANYWQRAGRAGRRHRMAVNFTYCRSVSHDRAYFAEPLKLLGGPIDPPAFHLSNELMVGKHVHACALTRLYQLARDGSVLGDFDRTELRDALETAFPIFVRDYLFDASGAVLPRPRDVRILHTVITKHQLLLEEAVGAAFRQGWPEEDAAVVTHDRLAAHVVGMTDGLEKVIQRLNRRLRWALSQMTRLEKRRQVRGSLDAEEYSFLERCRAVVSRLRGDKTRRRRQAEGVDDIVTYSVLAAEGFLPGHGLEIGSVRGMAEVPRWVRGLSDFDLPRAPSSAVREYVPGNLIYANGQRFVPRRYALDLAEERHDRIVFEVDTARQAIREQAIAGSGTPGVDVLTSMPICDLTLVHQSRIDDEEENRFQMSVAVYGRELDRHSGGQSWSWGERSIQLLLGLHLQLVNVGSNYVIRDRAEVGYPVCLVCGQSVSPLSSSTQRDDFRVKHLEWCGREAGAVAFHADFSADALVLRNCESRREAASLAEMIRFAAAELLAMEIDDLQVLIIAKSGTDGCDAVLYDPMPGGSGLLQQVCERFSEVLAAARRLAADCPSACDSSCIDCFRLYRNAFYHEHLDRHMMLECLDAWGDRLESGHAIPPRQPAATGAADGQPVNAAERRLKSLLRAAGFPDGRWQEQVLLPRPLGSTTPDVAYEVEDEPGQFVYIYLDGLSAHIHGNEETRERDIQIRSQLRSQGHDVIEITAVDLDDRAIMTRHFKKLARILMGREKAKDVDAEAERWFGAGAGVGSEEAGSAAAETPYPAPQDVSRQEMPLAAELSTFDPELYPLAWRELLTGLALREDMTVEPGGDVENESGVVGGYVAELRRREAGPAGGVALRIIDRNMPWAERVAELSRGQGRAVVLVDPSKDSCPTEIVDAWKRCEKAGMSRPVLN